MTQNLNIADPIIKLSLAVAVILCRAFGVISGVIADALFSLTILVVLYYFARLFFQWMLRD